MNDLDKLKDLLFGKEREALDSIAERVERPEMRASDVADVLAEAMHRSHSQGNELVESMAEPVGECLRQEFHEDPQTYGDALYPVMGPAIRKSIAQALRNLSQQINQAVEQSLTPRGIGWRIQAYRAGIPFGQFVLQKNLLYRVEQAYLISRENGLLIEHAHHESSKIKDSDAVSAMFTAIQDFVKESFSPDRTGRLESADMGEFTLWAVHGPHALLVCVIRGTPPNSLRNELTAVLEQIHFRYGEAVREYSGETSSVPEIRKHLQKCLEYQASQTTDDRKLRVSWPLLLLIIGLLVWLGYQLNEVRVEAQQLSRLEAALKDTPGIYLADVSRSGGRFFLRGMRDPLAKPISAVAAELGIPMSRIDMEFDLFQSLDEEIQLRRIEELIGLESVRYDLSGTVLTLSGEAPRQWIRDAENRLRVLPGLTRIDATGVTDIDLSRLQQDVAELSGSRFLFSSETSLETNAEADLIRFAVRLRDLQQLALILRQDISVELVGSTDSRGTAEFNARLAKQRADLVADILADHGVSWDAYRDESSSEAEAEAADNLAQRYVAINLTLSGINP